MRSIKIFSGVLALLLSTAAGVARADEHPPALPPELSWIPPNCTAFAHVRFAELWDGPLGRAMRAALQKSDPKMLAKIEQSLGVRLSQIDQITVVFPDASFEDDRDPFVVRITTTEPYDAKRVLAVLPLEERGQPIAPSDTRKLYPIQSGFVHLTDARNLTFIYSRSGAIGLLGKMLEHAASGPLTGALQLAAEKHQFVAGLNVSSLRNLPIDQAPPAFRPLFDARLATLVGDVKPESAEFSLRVMFSRPGHADEGAKAIEAVRSEALQSLTKLIADLMTDKEAAGRIKILEGIAGAIKDAKIETKDNQVQVAASLKTGGPLAAIAQEGLGAITISSSRAQSQNNLKQIGLAMHNYHASYNTLPPAAICDKNGKPLLSWRVAILPYIEQDNLYKQFKLDEPWDSEHNKKLAMAIPKTYLLPGDQQKHALPSTYYRVFYGNDAMFDLKKGTTFAQITDGLSNTIMVVEAADAVPWTKPDELEYDPNKAPKLGFHFGDRCNVLFGDGAVHALKKNIDANVLHLLIQRSDGKPVNIP